MMLAFARNSVCALLLISCAHAPERNARDVTLLTPQGGLMELNDGRVTVIEVCAGWADACLFNVRAVDEFCELRCGDRARAISVVLDDPAAPAIAGYRSVMNVHQELATPTPETRAGASALGSLKEIPAVFIFDSRGRLVDEIRGGVVSAGRLVTRVDALIKVGSPQ